MVKKVGQRRFLLKCGYTDEQLNHMSPHEAHTIISEAEAANRYEREAKHREAIREMVDNEKLVEEIAKAICPIIQPIQCRELCTNIGNCQELKDMCRKIVNVFSKHDTAVVLSKDDYNRIRSQVRSVIDLEAIILAEDRARREIITNFTEKLKATAYQTFLDTDDSQRKAAVILVEDVDRVAADLLQKCKAEADALKEAKRG